MALVKIFAINPLVDDRVARSSVLMAIQQIRSTESAALTLRRTVRATPPQLVKQQGSDQAIDLQCCSVLSNGLDLTGRSSMLIPNFE